jgi:hypothetical protein
MPRLRHRPRRWIASLLSPMPRRSTTFLPSPMPRRQYLLPQWLGRHRSRYHLQPQPARRAAPERRPRRRRPRGPPHQSRQSSKMRWNKPPAYKELRSIHGSLPSSSSFQPLAARHTTIRCHERYNRRIHGNTGKMWRSSSWKEAAASGIERTRRWVVPAGRCKNESPIHQCIRWS